jgi:hypothetical protein
MVKSADKPKSIHREPHQREDAGKSYFASSQRRAGSYAEHSVFKAFRARICHSQSVIWRLKQCGDDARLTTLLWTSTRVGLSSFDNNFGSIQSVNADYPIKQVRGEDGQAGMGENVMLGPGTSRPSRCISTQVPSRGW